MDQQASAGRWGTWRLWRLENASYQALFRPIGFRSQSEVALRQHGVTTMDVTEFDAERPRLMAIATRMLGSEADADDVLQEAWLRLSRTYEIDDPPAWLTTVVTRLCIDHLRKRRTTSWDDGEAEARAPADPVAVDPEADALLAETMGDAMQVVLDTLVPAERAAFVLHDVFGYPFDDVSAIMGRSGTAVRQLASRARRKVQGVPETPASRAARAESRRVVDAFLTAARGGDLSTLLLLLAPDAVMRADLVGRQMGTQSAYDGADAVAARFNGVRGAAPVTIDGDLGAAWIHAGEVKVAFIFNVEAGRVHEVELIADPDVIATMDIVRVRKRHRQSDQPDPSPHTGDGSTPHAGDEAAQ
jgi:RNA polymerase sigma-70 factor (ECF subfamily)